MGQQGPSVGAWIRLNQGFDAAARRSVEPHLDPGEEVQLIQPVRPRAGRWSKLTFPRLEVTPATVALPGLCVFAVSSRRFFVVSHDLAEDHVSTLVTGGRLEDVRSVELARGLAAHEVTWIADGARYALWANGKMAKQITEALQAGSGGA